MKLVRCTVFLFAVVSVAGTALDRAASGAERRARKPVRPAAAERAGTEKLWGIAWHPSIDAALAAAAGNSSADEKPVVCLRVLGDLKGFM
jgi:hypothetical protein